MESDSDFRLAPDKLNQPQIDETQAQAPGDIDSQTSIPVEQSNTALPSDSGYRAGDLIGRYVVVRDLGMGGFGHVLLAKDEKLRRQVAIKFPRRDRGLEQLKSFLEEGRSVARLDHPSIIKLFNIEETDDGLPFAVMEYVEGPTLQQVIQNRGLSFSDAIRYLIQIAEALEYAHGQTLIHRDLKPGNVIVSQDGNLAKLMDFGLALHDLTPESNMTRNPEGTPPYMSPEQIRGENHRLDGRTDVWGFGVMMYVMLTGRKPFSGETTSMVVQSVCFVDPRPPREINKLVPEELQRICLKCIEKLMSSRYQSASHLLDDLRGFEADWRSTVQRDPSVETSGVLPLADPVSGANLSTHRSASRSRVSEFRDTKTVKVVPKGLRSFDGQDAEFFVDLLPGPKDRYGIPDSLRFWLNRIMEDSLDPLTVGVLFGPSGCGKSSFVKAGLIPQLPSSYNIIYLEATPTKTEDQLLSRLERLAPSLEPGAADLPEAFRRVRRGQLLTTSKLLIVIDQFEQWLHSHSDLTNQPLIAALRQCDGKNLCCLLMVRDDFWMSATQFMKQLDSKVQEGVNALGIPLFDRRHARKVLAAYGRAFNAVGEQLTSAQNKFIADAVKEMSEDGKIIPIHLALFAQMTDSDSWDAAHFKRLGGWQGVGVQFLESIFADKRKARHENTCRAILEQLLPETLSDIKGAHKSLGDLAAATELTVDSPQFEDALDLLDREMRIITPTESDDGSGGGSHFQLAHDYLVQPIRIWLSQKERETWQGRAGVRLKELARQWQVNKENRFLPSGFEYIAMLFGVNRKTLPEHQKAFFHRASLFYGMRLAVLVLVAISVGLVARAVWKSTEIRLAQEKFGSLLVASPEEVDARLELLEPFGADTITRLIGSQPDRAEPRSRLRLLFAQSRFGSPQDIPLDALLSTIGTASNGECVNFIDALRPLANGSSGASLFAAIDNRFAIADSSELKFRLAVISMHLGNKSLASKILEFQPDPEQREQFIQWYPGWHGDLGETIALLEGPNEPSFVIGLFKAIGQIPRSQFTSEQFNALNRVAGNLWASAMTPGEHSAAVWLMKQLEMNAPSGLAAAPNHSWFIKEVVPAEPITFLKVESQTVHVGSGLRPQEFKLHAVDQRDEFLDHGFFMSASEVPASLFMRYVATLDKEHSTRQRLESRPIYHLASHDLPISRVSWIEAARFCNWLSDQDGRTPRYQFDENTKRWQSLVDANGYRLPTYLEWDAANRFGTDTKFFFGDSTAGISRYAIVGNHDIQFELVELGLRGQKMPNDNGFFDMMGNTAEWCDDLHRKISDGFEYRSVRGGSAMNSVTYLTSGSVFYEKIHEFSFPNGIRLVLDEQ